MKEPITNKDLIGWVLTPTITVIVTGAIGWYTGSWEVVWSFACARPGESFVCALTVFFAGTLVGMLIRWRIDGKRFAADSAEIARLRERPTQDQMDQLANELGQANEENERFNKKEAKLSSFRKRFKALGPGDMEWVIRVYRTGGHGLLPSSAELAHFNDGVAIKGFLRLDAASQRLFLVDGVEDMIDLCGDLVAYSTGVVVEQKLSEANARIEAAEAKVAEYEGKASKLAEDDRILHMDYLAKGLLYAIATGDRFVTRDDDPSYLSANAKNLDAFQRLLRMGLANYETCGMHEIRWFGTELAAKLVEEHVDLFGNAKEEVEELRKRESEDGH